MECLDEGVGIVNIESFKEAFHTGVGGCRRKCECGVQFYNTDGGWDWEEGELEELEADESARDIDCTVSTVYFLGMEYVYQCDCWHEDAEKIMNFIDDHAHCIAQYLRLEKNRMQEEVDNMPTV
jgi:hypothetical protein